MSTVASQSAIVGAAAGPPTAGPAATVVPFAPARPSAPSTSLPPAVKTRTRTGRTF